MMSRADIIQAAEARLRQAGLCPKQIIADGRKHRCPVEGKPKGQDGEYRIYADDCPRVVWKNYRTGDYGTDKLYSTESGHAFDRAEYILSKAVAAVSNHPYLVRKGVAVPPGLKMKDGKLIVPAYDAEGELRTIQFIDGEGSKRFLKDGQVQGASFALRGVGNADAIYLTEGLATGTSVWQALDGQAEVRVCFSAANLVQVASSLRGRPIIVCADNDRFTPGNPGLTKALEATKAVGGRVSPKEAIMQLPPTLLKKKEEGFTTAELVSFLATHKIAIKPHNLTRYLREYSSPPVKSQMKSGQQSSPSASTVLKSDVPKVLSELK